MNNQQAYLRAKKRAETKYGFYLHLVIFVVVNAVLIVVNVSTSPDILWFKWPLLGWGIGVVFHALQVFVFYGKSTVTAKMIEREMRREGGSTSQLETP